VPENGVEDVMKDENIRLFSYDKVRMRLRIKNKDITQKFLTQVE